MNDETAHKSDKLPKWAKTNLMYIIRELENGTKQKMKYKCGHKTNKPIILDDNILSMSVYLEWAEVENNLETKKECFDCYLKKNNYMKLNTLYLGEKDNELERVC